MPIIIPDGISLNMTASAPKKATVKFFTKDLTGSGKKTGLLNSSLLPTNSLSNSQYSVPEHIEVKQHHSQNDITTSFIPTGLITRRALCSDGVRATLPVPVVGAGHAFEVDPGPGVSSHYDVIFQLTPQAAILWKDASGDFGTKTDFIVQYRMELHIVDKQQSPAAERTLVTTSSYSSATAGDIVHVAYSDDPMNDAANWINDLLGKRVAGTSLRASLRNADELSKWMTDFSVHDAILDLVEAWSTDAIADEVNHYIDGLGSSPSSEQLNELARQLRYLENYKVSLEAYRAINLKLESAFSEKIATSLAKQNQNLLVNHTLVDLGKHKAQLVTPALPAGQQPVLPAYLSAQQLAAITTLEPLVLVESGAGTGKTSVIMQRIDFLKQCAVDESDITVLSFTNAAADNVIARNPNVHAMTIARMVNEIYQLNHPTHEVSDAETVVNSLDIFFPADPIAQALKPRLINVKNNKDGAMTTLNTFVENHFDRVMEMLDAIKQTTLDLEIITCYQQIDTMIEPAGVQSKYLIVDEVQDNSVFEFIYLLKYVAKHRQSIFIVGDPSQTLFEFRSANPRALNTLESSGVFWTTRLTTNYRSNQCILDFANTVLSDLETNQFANIQLQANSLAVPDAATFQDRVKLHYTETSKFGEYLSSDLPGLMQSTVIPQYVQKCLDRGEQVAFLAYSRKQVSQFQELLTQAFPNKTVASLVSDKHNASDAFSKYVKEFWNDVLQVKPKDASFAFVKGLQDNMSKILRNADQDWAQRRLLGQAQDWTIQNKPTVDGWVQMVNIGSLSTQQFFDDLRDNILAFEIKLNGARLHLTSKRNQERKEANQASKPDLVVSTIHGAKGLEFDNAVVLHKDDGSTMTEDNKRLFYVAFTRAMNTQFVLSYGKLKNAPIKTNYEQLVHALHVRDATSLARQTVVDAGLDPDSIDLQPYIDKIVAERKEAAEAAAGADGDADADNGTDANAPAAATV